MRRPLLLCAAVLPLLVVCVLLLSCATPALAKSYTMPSVKIDAHVTGDGTLQVREERVFDFDGSFSWVQWKLDTGGASDIRVFGVTGPTGQYTSTETETSRAGTYVVSTDGGTVYVKIFHDTADAEARFVIEYLALGAAKAYTDTAELYWQFVGDESEVGVGSVDKAV
jgi:hypothetical protein